MGRTKNWKKGYEPLTNKDLQKEKKLAEEDLKEYTKYKPGKNNMRKGDNK